MRYPFLAQGAALLVLVLLSGCTSQPPAASTSIEGRWNYTLLDSAGNTYDQGTMDFEGDGPSGVWLQVNYYRVEYTGTYRLGDDGYEISGAETWRVRLSSEAKAQGTWTNNQGEGGKVHLSR